VDLLSLAGHGGATCPGSSCTCKKGASLCWARAAYVSSGADMYPNDNGLRGISSLTQSRFRLNRSYLGFGFRNQIQAHRHTVGNHFPPSSTRHLPSPSSLCLSSLSAACIAPTTHAHRVAPLQAVLPNYRRGESVGIINAEKAHKEVPVYGQPPK
jgi:hypothetical protein